MTGVRLRCSRRQSMVGAAQRSFALERSRSGSSAATDLDGDMATSPKQQQVLVTPLEAPNDRTWGALQTDRFEVINRQLLSGPDVRRLRWEWPTTIGSCRERTPDRGTKLPIAATTGNDRLR